MQTGKNPDLKGVAETTFCVDSALATRFSDLYMCVPAYERGCHLPLQVATIHEKQLQEYALRMDTDDTAVKVQEQK